MSAPAAETAVTGSSSPRRRQIVRFFIPVICVAIGVGIGLAARKLRPRPATAMQDTAQVVSHATHQQNADSWDAIADRIRIGDVDGAAERCQAQLAAKGTRDPHRGQYLLALCEEHRGKFQPALTAWTHLEEHGPEMLRSASQFGRARCLTRLGKLDDARLLLNRLESLTEPEPKPAVCIADEIAAWRAAIEILAVQAAPESSFSVRACLPAELRPCVDRYLAWIDGRSGEHHVLAGPSARSEHRIAVLQKAAALREHPFAADAALELGNMLAREGKLHEAQRSYERLPKDAPASMHRRADYNLGLVNIRLLNHERARENFLNVIDRAADDETAGLAWWWIARTHLDCGEFELAGRPLRYARASDSPTVRSAAALAIGVVRFLAEDDENALASLRGAPRSGLRSPALRSDAALLEAYTQLRIARRNRPKPLGETESMIWAISELSAESALGPCGALLRGKALQEFDMNGQMARILHAELSSSHGPLAIRMSEMIADHYLDVENVAAARPLLLALSTSIDASARHRARLKLARIALDAGRHAECLEWCRDVPPDTPGHPDPPLRLMGLAFESLGDARRAADCFSGLAPGK